MTTLTYDTLGDVPEGIRDFAKEGEDGKFAVKVAASDKITQFRENNVKLSQDRDAMAASVAKYEEVTGVKIAEIDTLEDFAKALTALRAIKKRVDDGNLVEDTSLEEASAKRVTDVTNGFKEQLAELARDRDSHRDRANKADERADGMLVENAVRLVASDPDVAMLDKAVNLVLSEARAIFRVEDTKLVPKSTDGTTLYGSNGVDAMTIKEWLLKQREANEFLFKGSKGGGAAGASDTIAGKISTKELAAMSPQARINWSRKHAA